MTNAKLNVIVLDDFRKPNANLHLDSVKAFLTEKRNEMRAFETEAFELYRTKHKSSRAEIYISRALDFEEVLLTVSDWLEAKIAEREGAEKEAHEKVLKECEALRTRNEGNKKNLDRDVTKSVRAENKRELDPVKVVGFVVGTPLTLINLVKTFAPNRTDLLIDAGVGGLGLGSILAFRHQAGALVSHTATVIKGSPNQLKKVAKASRSSFIGVALSVSVASKRANDIEPTSCSQIEQRPRIFYSAKM